MEFIRQEANVWARASGHPNVLPIIEANVYDNRVVIASEFAPDGSLEIRINKNGGRTVSIESAVEIVIGILSGLEHLHSRNIIHRDVKPANIIFQGETPRLTDFGVSRVLKSSGQSTTSAGTPIYMAPEAFDGKRSVQTDIWSVGIIFYELLSGKLPFVFDDLTSLWKAVALNDFDSLPNDVPERLHVIVMKALQRDTALRYRSAAEMRADLKRFTSLDRVSETFDSSETIPSFRMPNDVPFGFHSDEARPGNKTWKSAALVAGVLLIILVSTLGIYFIPQIINKKETTETGESLTNTLTLPETSTSAAINSNNNVNTAAEGKQCSVIKKSDGTAINLKRYCDSRDCSLDANTMALQIDPGTIVEPTDRKPIVSGRFTWIQVKYRGEVLWVSSSLIDCEHL